MELISPPSPIPWTIFSGRCLAKLPSDNDLAAPATFWTLKSHIFLGGRRIFCCCYEYARGSPFFGVPICPNSTSQKILAAYHVCVCETRVSRPLALMKDLSEGNNSLTEVDGANIPGFARAPFPDLGLRCGKMFTFNASPEGRQAAAEGEVKWNRRRRLSSP